MEVNLKELIQNNISFTKMRETSILVLEYLFAQPITGISDISKKTGKAYNTIQNILQGFIKHNIVSESIINKRNKLYRFEPYINLLEKEYL